jgi:hypothetical protein
VHDPTARCEPLCVAAPEPGDRAERIRVIDQALSHDGHGFEPAMWMVWEAGYIRPVVHPPAVTRFEVVADLAPFESGWAGAEVSVAGGYLSR